MKVNINVMLESNGNWWVSLFIKNKENLSLLDGVEIPYGKSVAEAVYKAGELRKKFNTGQILVDKQELKPLISNKIFTEDRLTKICEDVEFML